MGKVWIYIIMLWSEKTYKVIILLLFYVIFTWALNKKKNLIIKIQNYIIGVYLLSIWQVWINVNWGYLLLNFVVGYIATPIVLNCTCRIAFRKKYFFRLKIEMLENCLEMFPIILYEEVIWRYTVNKFFEINSLPNSIKVFCYALITILFVFSHSSIGYEKKEEIVEMLLFSGMLTFTAIWFEGMNIGMHLCRNILIIEQMKENG